jgi:pyruvate dehydrogenase (quinone)
MTFPAHTGFSGRARGYQVRDRLEEAQMTETVADHVLTRLREWGVRQVFGYPGDGINGLVAAFGKSGDRPQFVQARHEEMSAFAAVGYAKFSGEVAVCLATSGPGAIHLLNGLYDAKLDHVPIVAIVGQTARSAMGGSYQQEVDLQTLFKDVASDYLVEVNVANQLPNALDRAFRTARARRAPTAVVIPSDLQEEPYEPPAHAFKHVPSSGPHDAGPVMLPERASIVQAAEMLNAGSKVAILVGQGARGAQAELRELAELTGAGVAKALLGKDVLPDDLPYVTGSIGLLGTRPSYELMRDCDTLLIVGSNFPYSQFLPEFGKARAIQIDIDGTAIGMRYPTEVNIIADAKAALAELIPLLQRQTDRSWRQTVEANVARWWRTVERQAMLAADPVNPMRVVWELSARLPANAIVTGDSGSSTNWYARCLRFGPGVLGSLSGTLATMGPAVPYAIGAKFAHPDRPVIALVGDGAMQMNGLAELLTVRRYCQQWSDRRLVVCVFHNNDLCHVTWELRAMGGAPKFEESQTLPEVSYAEAARVIGLNAIAVDDPERLGEAWDAALSAEAPTLLDVRTDPEVPPIPPHVTYDQIKATAEAIVKGDPNGWRLFAEIAKSKAAELLPQSG